MALAHLLGNTPHLSPLLRKAARRGYSKPDDLLHLAVARGCRHYGAAVGEAAKVRDCGKDQLSNTELAVALISGSLQGDARHIRVAAQLLGAPDINRSELVRLARMERCVPILRYIAEAGAQADTEQPLFWREILNALPETPPIPEGRMPHPSRFVSNPGWSPPSRPHRRASWLRAHG